MVANISGEQGEDYPTTSVRGLAMLEGQHPLACARDAGSHRERHSPICQEQGGLVDLYQSLQRELKVAERWDNQLTR